MYNITVNKKKNRLYVSVGDSDSSEMKVFLEKLEHSCRDLLSGFTCITEIPKTGSVRQEYQDLQFSTEDLILAYGVSKVVRVTHHTTAAEVLERNPLSNRASYDVAQVTTLKEAEKLLDN